MSSKQCKHQFEDSFTRQIDDEFIFTLSSIPRCLYLEPVLNNPQGADRVVPQKFHNLVKQLVLE